jgi:hypothetical protein
MAAPTFVSYTDTGFNTSAATASVATSSISVTSGDLLVAVGTASNDANSVTIAGGSLTWTAQQSSNTVSNAFAALWTATATSTTSFAVTFTRVGTGGVPVYGGGVYVFRAASIGASAKSTNTTGAPSLALLTTQANSAIVVINADWNAIDGATRTWRTINSVTPTAGNGLEKKYLRNATEYTVYTGYWDDVGGIATDTTGLSAPSGQKFTLIAFEVKGTVTAAGKPWPTILAFSPPHFSQYEE